MSDCTQVYNCEDCIAQAGCGWCGPANCVAGSSLGPLVGSCSPYKYKVRTFESFPLIFHQTDHVLSTIQSCTFSNGMIGGLVAFFVCFGVFALATLVLICWCKCKRGPVEKPVSTRGLELETIEELKSSPTPIRQPEPSHHPHTDNMRKAMEEKYRRNFPAHK